MSFPLSLPSTNFRDLDIRMETAVGITESPFSFKGQKVAWPGSRWHARVELPPVKDVATARAWMAFLAGLRGKEGTFLMGDPFSAAPRGSWAGPPVIDGTQSGYTVNMRGFTASATDVAKAGDFYQVGTGQYARLLIATEDVDADGSGDAAVPSWPRWKYQDTDDGAAVSVSNPVGVWRLDAEDPGWTIRDLLLYGFGFEAVEDF